MSRFAEGARDNFVNRGLTGRMDFPRYCLSQAVVGNTPILMGQASCASSLRLGVTTAIAHLIHSP
jgi:hypothetical protein